MSTRRLSMPTMLAFGIGQAAEGIKNQAFNVFLLFYYQQVIGIPGTLAGLALGIALFFDAISDPAAGVISDRFKSKWGRRHPFMLFSAVPLVITFIALFNPPDGLSEFFNFVWLTVFAVLVRASLTFYYVPHLALGADMAHDYHQRSTLYAMSTVFSITAMAVVSFVGYRFFFPTTELFNPGTLNPAAYSDFSITFAAVMFVVIIISCLGTAREIPHLHNSPPKRTATIRNILRDYKEVLGNRSFQLIFFGMLLTTTVVSFEAVLSPFMGVHFWGLPTERLAFISIGTMLGLWIGLPLAPLLTRLLDKKRALVFPAIFVIINANAALILRLLDVEWFPDNESPWIFWIFFIRYFLQGIFLPVIFASFNSMFADIADEVELDTGERREGVIFSARSFANKAVGAVGTLVGGIALDLIAFPSAAVAGTVPDDVVWWLGFLEGPASSVFSFLGIVFYLRYKIDRKRHEEIVKLVADRKKNAEEVTEEVAS
ncbi:MAG: GPH family glycoside/pentoside/hexuronide:cation symporter [Candidatus Azotimanducaceae bacterium]|jgi:GPH family glycoside/pentoside/hexuronide:cation symporter